MFHLGGGFLKVRAQITFSSLSQTTNYQKISKTHLPKNRNPSCPVAQFFVGAPYRLKEHGTAAQAKWQQGWAGISWSVWQTSVLERFEAVWFDTINFGIDILIGGDFHTSWLCIGDDWKTKWTIYSIYQASISARQDASHLHLSFKRAEAIHIGMDWCRHPDISEICLEMDHVNRTSWWKHALHTAKLCALKVTKGKK